MLFIVPRILILIIISLKEFQMGQSTSAQEQRFSNLLNNYAEDIRCQFGTILKHKQTLGKFLLRQITLMDQKEYNNTLQKYKIEKNNIKENILNLIEVQGRIKTNFCSGSFKIFLIFEFSNTTLSEEIKARGIDFRYFQQQDVWSIMQSCLNGIKELGSETIILDSKKIFIMADGIIKIIHPSIDNDGSKFILEEEIYYAPQRYQNFSNCDRGSYSEKQIIFSLGMLILNSCILEELFDCYQQQNLSFNASVLSQKIEKLKTKTHYSQQLTLIIQSLVQVDQTKRLSIQQLKQIMNKFCIFSKQFINKNEKEQQLQESKILKQPEDATIEYHQYKKQTCKQKNSNYKQQNIQLCNQTTKFKESPQILPNKITVSEIIDKDKVIKQINSLRQQKYKNRCTNPQISQRSYHQKSQNQSQNFAIVNKHKKHQSMNITSNQNKFVTFKDKNKQIKLKNKIQNNRHYQSTNLPITDNFIFYRGPQTYRPNNNFTDHTMLQNYPKVFHDNQNLFTDPKILEICRKQIEISQRKSFQKSTFQSGIYNISQQPFKESIILNITNTNKQLRQNAQISSNVSPAVLLNKPAKSFFNPIYTNSSYKPQAEFTIKIYQDGKKYEGDIVNGIKEGNGKLIYPDGAYYEGNFFDDKMQGYGILYYGMNRPAYQGYWNEDQFHGNGILYNQNPISLKGSFNFRNFNEVEDFWSHYEGNFEFDNKQGKGKLILANGEFFEGQFHEDFMNGKGEFHDIHGQIHKGIWRNNIFQHYL